MLDKAITLASPVTYKLCREGSDESIFIKSCETVEDNWPQNLKKYPENPEEIRKIKLSYHILQLHQTIYEKCG